MKPCVVPPIRPLEGRHLHVHDIAPSMGMGEFVLLGVVDILS